MGREGETVEDRADAVAAAPPVPGVVVIYTRDTPVLHILPGGGEPVALGRLSLGTSPVDETLSREHAEVARLGSRWLVRDLGSRNGTFLDGQRVRGEVLTGDRAVLRIGHTVLLLEPDLRPLLGGAPTSTPDTLVGPRLRAALAAIARARGAGDSLLLLGESGSGKELAARAYHAGSGPFVAVNCAAIPGGLAERLLFGAVRGAYSGASADASGYLESAHGGTLFLDEVGELEPAVQGKLLRALETREILPLGGSRPVPVSLRVCAATHRDLRRDVAAGRLRQDLYYRLARQEVVLPALRERPEDIPWLLVRELERIAPGLRPDGHFVEACCLRPWPGNVRELLSEARHAGVEARAARDERVGLRHLRASAGARLDETAAVAAQGAPAAPAGRPTRVDVQAAMARARGNVSAAARALGLHRNQLRRLLAGFAGGPDETPSQGAPA